MPKLPLNSNLATKNLTSEAKFDFGGSLGVSLEGECHEFEVTPNLELLVTLGISLEGVCHELYL
jgi:hypothetical protein